MRTVPASALPVVNTNQMREVDRIMTDELAVNLLQMMENAGRSLASLCIELYAPSSVLVLAGSGGNGGGGLAAARHLANHGVDIVVVIAAPRERLVPAARAQLAILDRMGVPTSPDLPETECADVVIDALVGYSLEGAPRGRVAELIEWAQRNGSAILSLDAPSGFDSADGRVHDPCIHADATLTLAALKVGLVQAPQSGDVYLADISVPPSVLRRVGQDATVDFGSEWMVRAGREGRPT